MAGTPDINGFLPSDSVNVTESTFAQRAAENAFNKDITFDQKTGQPKIKASVPKRSLPPSLDEMRAMQSQFVPARPVVTHQDRLRMLNPTALDFGDDY